MPTPVELNIPPLRLPPDGASSNVVTCYTKAAIKYLSNVMICQTISDPVAAQNCINNAHTIYTTDLSGCDSLD